MAVIGTLQECMYYPTSGALACTNRFVKLDSSGYLQLAGATDTNCIGVGLVAADQARAANEGRPTSTTGAPYAQLLTAGYLAVEVASGVTFAPGDIVYGAASGKATNSSSGGAVRRGVAVTAATEGQTVQFVAC